MIKLVFFDRTDCKQLVEWSGDEAFLLQWAGPQFKYPLTEGQLDKYIEGSNNIQNSDKLIYKAIDTETESIVGHISIGGIDRENRSGRIGKVLVGGTTSRGNGIGQKMMNAVLKIGFEELELHRISLGVFDFNESAIICYEKVGFIREGLIRDARRFKDTYWNLIEMSILEDEWRKTNL
jgi:RimJ/RimL family protein N-acetyltransferase